MKLQLLPPTPQASPAEARRSWRAKVGLLPLLIAACIPLLTGCSYLSSAQQLRQDYAMLAVEQAAETRAEIQTFGQTFVKAQSDYRFAKNRQTHADTVASAAQVLQNQHQQLLASAQAQTTSDTLPIQAVPGLLAAATNNGDRYRLAITDADKQLATDDAQAVTDLTAESARWAKLADKIRSLGRVGADINRMSNREARVYSDAIKQVVTDGALDDFLATINAAQATAKPADPATPEVPVPAPTPAPASQRTKSRNH